jgi:uncharacterized protein (TIGR02246 family)
VTHDQIETAYRRVLGAWNRRDADAFAAAFTEDGHAISFDGARMDGRASIASTLQAVFQNELVGTYVATVLEIREIAPGVTLLCAIVGMVPTDSFDLDLMVTAEQSVVFTSAGDEVRIALLQSTPASVYGRADVAEMLKLELEEFQRAGRVRH